MAESSASLVRSLSQPTDFSTEPKEGDPLRTLLTTSVSFGRFMSEPLSWEKWSCFSNNRYLEEAEKISKPGSVAEKKAILEAHYKKIAAKKAVALHEQENTACRYFHKPDIVENSPNNSSVELESSESVRHVVIDEIQEKGEPNVLNPNVERNNLEMEKTEEVELETEKLDIAEKLISEVPKQHENVGDPTKNPSSQQEKMSITNAANQGNLVSTIKKKQSTSSSRLFTDIQVSRVRSSVKFSPAQPIKEENATRTSRKSERASMEKKRSMPRSFHMSVDYSSHGEISNRSTPPSNKIENSKGVKAFSKISRDGSTLPQTPTRASVTGLSAHSSTIVQSERRIKTPDNHSVPRSRTADRKTQYPAIDSKSSGAFRQKTRSPLVASTFSFRCEGRVAKRKEFFQKLEEKQKAKEAEKMHLQAKSKKKAEDDFKKMRQSSGFVAKLTGNSQLETEAPVNHIKKTPLTRPQSPKLGNKPNPSLVLDNSSRPPSRPRVKTDGSKHIKEKTNRTPIRSSCTMLRKNVKENGSPNIQLLI